MTTAKRFVDGTHRSRTPEQTWAAFQPAFERVGITRLARVTRLDHIGIPVFCAIRPDAKTLQVSNGKGVTDMQAKVSAAMESAELWHAEQPPDGGWSASSHDAGVRLETLRSLQGFLPSLHVDERMVLDWVEADELLGDGVAPLPRGAAYVSARSHVAWTSNGLASGNTLEEATLHAIYELVERDSIARMSENGALALKRRGRRIPRDSVDDPGVRWMWGRIHDAGCELHVIEIPSTAAVMTTIWAFMIDPEAANRATAVNYGFGTHLSPSVATSRAISEAAQSRLTFIHGAREDLDPEAFSRGRSLDRLRAYFADFGPEVGLDALEDSSRSTLEHDLDTVLDAIRRGPFDRVLRVDLSRAGIGIPVVKVVIPGSRINYRYV